MRCVNLQGTDTDKIGKQSNIQEGFFQKKGREGYRNFR